MLSWDTLVVAPLILCMVGVMEYKKNTSWKYLLFIPLYIVIRMLSHAVLLAGDYGINASRFIVNAVGNSMTYSLATLFGPKAIEISQNLRILTKSYSLVFSVFGFVIAAFLLRFCWVKRVKILKDKWLVIIGLSYGIVLLPFVGLGGASERYALLPSVFLLVFIGLCLERISRKVSSVRVVSLLIMGGLVIWNYTALGNLAKEWQFAGHVTEQTLKTIRAQFFTTPTNKTYVFIDTPIRYGRAWIFPTGLDDALWHMYQQTPYYFTQVKTIDDAFAFPSHKDTDKVILQFENYNLEQVVKQKVE